MMWEDMGFLKTSLVEELKIEESICPFSKVGYRMDDWIKYVENKMFAEY